MSIFSKIFGTHSQHEVKRIIPIVDKIEALVNIRFVRGAGYVLEERA